MQKTNQPTKERIEKITKVIKALYAATQMHGHIRSKDIGKITRAHKIGNGIETYLIRFGWMRNEYGNYKFILPFKESYCHEFATYLYQIKKEYNRENKDKRDAASKQLACKFDPILYQLNSNQMNKVLDAYLENQPCVIEITDIEQYL